jgi:hypothetical protein
VPVVVTGIVTVAVVVTVAVAVPETLAVSPVVDVAVAVAVGVAVPVAVVLPALPVPLSHPAARPTRQNVAAKRARQLARAWAVTTERMLSSVVVVRFNSARKGYLSRIAPEPGASESDGTGVDATVPVGVPSAGTAPPPCGSIRCMGAASVTDTADVVGLTSTLPLAKSRR